MTLDMTVGSPSKHIIKFCIPVLVGNLIQQFYNIADAVIVGNAIGTDALAAVGVTGPITFMMLGFAMGLTGGFAVIPSQRFGAGDMAGLRRSVAVAMTLSAGASLILTAISMLTAYPILRWMNTPEELLALSGTYLFVIYAGLAGTIFYNLSASVLRAVGDSKTPLYFLLLASVLNVGLDWVFVVPLNTGIGGAAFATILSQLLSGVLCWIYAFRRYEMLRLKREDFRMNVHQASAQLRIGLPMAFQFSVTAIGTIVLQRALNQFGTIKIAAYTTGVRIEQLVLPPAVALSATIATFVGQNVGAGNIQRVRKGVFQASVMCMASSLLSTVVVLFLGAPLLRMFADEYKEEVAAYGVEYFRIVSPFYIVLGMLLLLRSALQGMGDSLVPMLSGTTELVMRFVIAFTLPSVIGYYGVCWASPAAWVGAVILLVPSFFIRTKQLRKRLTPKTVSSL